MKTFLKSKLTLPFLVFFSLSLSIAAQSTGKVVILVLPKGFVAKFDTVTVRQYGKVLEAPVGTYRVQMWAPRRVYVDTSVTVIADSLVKIRRLLPHNAAWEQYKLDKKQYGIARTYPWLLALGTAASAGKLIYAQTQNYGPARRDLLDQADVVKQEWRFSQDAAEDAALQAQMDYIENEFKKLRTRQWINGVTFSCATIAFGLLAWQGFKKAGRLEKPVWQETPLLSRLQVAPVYSPTGAAGAQLTLHF